MANDEESDEREAWPRGSSPSLAHSLAGDLAGERSRSMQRLN